MAMHDMRLETKQAALAIEDVELDGSFSSYANISGLSDLGNDVIERALLPVRLPAISDAVIWWWIVLACVCCAILIPPNPMCSSI